MTSTRSPETGLAAAWNGFFFTPADPAPLGLLRIATGLLLLWSVLCLGFDLPGFLGSEGWVDQAILRDVRIRDGRWEWSLWSAVPDALLWPAWALAIVVLGLFASGTFTKVTAPLAWAIAVSTSRRNPQILFGFDNIVNLWAFCLAATFQSGRTFSVDRWWARRRNEGDATPSIAANLGIRLVQLHLAIIYGAAGIAKLRGLSWSDGSALITILGNAEFRPFDLTGILEVPGALYLLNAATFAALWTEVLYPVLIWPASSRRWMLGAAVAMHAGIAVTLGLSEFSMAMLAGNLAFVSGARLRRWIGRRHGPRERAEIGSNGGGSPPTTPSSRPAIPPERPRR